MIKCVCDWWRNHSLTETHPFQVKGKGWLDASELTPGDVVYTKDWCTATVNSVNLLELEEPVEVFNFEVEDCHTYFVGDGLFLVHNAGCGDYKKIDPKKFEADHNLPNKTYHTTVKPKITSTVKPNHTVGKNPDIMLNRKGNIAYQGAAKGVKVKGFQETGLNISSILSELGFGG